MDPEKKMMRFYNILFVNPKGLGQFEHMIFFFAKNPMIKVTLLTHKGNGFKIPRVRVRTYGERLSSDTDALQKLLLDPFQEALSVFLALKKMKEEESYYPDLVVGHSGWGSLTAIKDIYPETRLVGYFEWFFSPLPSFRELWGEGMDPEEFRFVNTIRNHSMLSQLNACDVRYSPTNWQRSVFPKEYQDSISVIHDGIDTKFFSPRAGSEFSLPEQNLHFTDQQEIVTYVSRGFEPTRCFPTFMDAIRILLKRRPDCQVVIAGNDRAFYQTAYKNGKTCGQAEVEKAGYDASRVHFVGWLPREKFLSLLRVSSVHVYLTVPFVLSWSVLQAMSAGCCVVSSSSEPVMEVIQDRVNGLLADYHFPLQVADKMEEALEDKKLNKRLREAARETILEKYSLTSCLQKQSYLLLGNKF